jgi:hypothetical protein
MGGGLMQLVAYGAQDIYLTGNPQITFFKVVYRRHTNFSMEDIAQTPNGSVTISAAGAPSASFTISRNGDLVHKMYLQMDINAKSGATAIGSVGHALLNEIECEIGGQKIDKHYGTWLDVWAGLTVPNERGVRANVGVDDVNTGELWNTGFVEAEGDSAGGGFGVSLYDKMSYNYNYTSNVGTGVATEHRSKFIHVPLQFWFNRNPGLALPLIALQYHEVKIKILFNSLNSITDGTNTGGFEGTGIELFTQYIYLDTDERRRFAQVSHEYLIEQLQYQNESSASTFTLNFNHPVKELIWTGAPANGESNLTTSIGADTHWQIKLNGHDRFSARPLQYFTKQQVYDYHGGPGSFGGAPDSVAVYSFALKPEEHQPSGTCNFSRIDTAQLQKTSGTDGAIKIYAVNYNVLRIMSGMGGLAYSN